VGVPPTQADLSSAFGRVARTSHKVTGGGMQTFLFWFDGCRANLARRSAPSISTRAYCSSRRTYFHAHAPMTRGEPVIAQIFLARRRSEKGIPLHQFSRWLDHDRLGDSRSTMRLVHPIISTYCVGQAASMRGSARLRKLRASAIACRTPACLIHQPSMSGLAERPAEYRLFMPGNPRDARDAERDHAKGNRPDH